MEVNMTLGAAGCGVDGETTLEQLLQECKSRTFYPEEGGYVTGADGQVIHVCPGPAGTMRLWAEAGPQIPEVLRSDAMGMALCLKHWVFPAGMDVDMRDGIVTFAIVVPFSYLGLESLGSDMDSLVSRLTASCRNARDALCSISRGECLVDVFDNAMPANMPEYVAV